MKNFKEIHIGKIIYQASKERNVETTRIINFLKCTEKEIDDMYSQNTIDTETLLKWSKLLKYDFFRLYSQHYVLLNVIDALVGMFGLIFSARVSLLNETKTS